MHADSCSRVWEQAHSVTGCALPLKGISLKVDAVDVRLRPQPEGVPHNPVPSTHLQSGKVPVHVSVHG